MPVMRLLPLPLCQPTPPHTVKEPCLTCMYVCRFRTQVDGLAGYSSTVWEFHSQLLQTILLNLELVISQNSENIKIMRLLSIVP